MTRLILFGAAGRMGRVIQGIAAERDDVEVGEAFDAGSPLAAPAAPGVVVDFSAPAGFHAALAYAVEHRQAFVSGTTGLEAADLAKLDEAAAVIPVLFAANMSLGVTVLKHLAALTSAALAEFEIELMEIHHHHKKDAPSGTAIALVEAANAGRGRAPREGLRTSRSGLVGAREPGEIGAFGIRGTDVVGEHTLFFFGQGERVELTHRATDRAIFAHGAVRAARWIDGKPAGRYTIEDVLGLA